MEDTALAYLDEIFDLYYAPPTYADDSEWDRLFDLARRCSFELIKIMVNLQMEQRFGGNVVSVAAVHVALSMMLGYDYGDFENGNKRYRVKAMKKIVNIPSSKLQRFIGAVGEAQRAVLLETDYKGCPETRGGLFTSLIKKELAPSRYETATATLGTMPATQREALYAKWRAEEKKELEKAKRDNPDKFYVENADTWISKADHVDGLVSTRLIRKEATDKELVAMESRWGRFGGPTQSRASFRSARRPSP